MGWYAMALVDTLDHFPADNPRRAELIAILNRTAAAIEKYQDKNSGVWWDILDMGGKEKNYLESSVSAMFVYSLARGVREGYLSEKYMKTAVRGWNGIKKEFIKTNANGDTDWEGTVAVSGLGGKPYRDGSYDYYISEKVRTNDAKGLGPAIKAALEMESYERGWPGLGRRYCWMTILITKRVKNKLGRDESWHYKWDEMTDGGFSIWGSVFRASGRGTATAFGGPDSGRISGTRAFI